LGDHFNRLRQDALGFPRVGGAISIGVEDSLCLVASQGGQVADGVDAGF